MSGSGGGGGGDFLPDNPQSSCEDLIFSTSLASPDAEVVSELSKGLVLPIELRQKSIVLIYNEQVVGSIIENVPSLVSCIQNRVRFQAEITEISRGHVIIWVSPVL